MPELPTSSRPFDKLRERLRDELRGRCRDELRERRRDELRERCRDELRGRCRDGLRGRRRDELRGRRRDELRGRCRDGLRGRCVAATVVAALALLAGCSTTGADEPTRGAGQQGYVGSDGVLTRVAPDRRAAAPTLSGPRLGTDGTTISTADYPGKVLVLNVWGSWCGPCRQEAPALQAASVATRADAQFIGIDTRDTSPAAPEAFQRTQGITYPSIYDPSGQSLLQLGGQVPPAAIPSTLVLDRQGRVAIRVLGAVTQQTLTDMVSEVAAGR